MSTPRIKEALLKTRELLSDPSKYTSGWFAKDKNGIRVGFEDYRVWYNFDPKVDKHYHISDECVSFCLMGAYQHFSEAWSDGFFEFANSVVRKYYSKYEEWPSTLGITLGGWPTITQISDRSYEDCIKFLDLLIKECENV